MDSMFQATSLKSGAECGAKQETSGVFRAPHQNTKLEEALSGAWKVDE